MPFSEPLASKLVEYVHHGPLPLKTLLSITNNKDIILHNH